MPQKQAAGSTLHLVSLILALGAVSTPAMAEPIFAASFTGTVTLLNDGLGEFTGTGAGVGSAVSGHIVYDAAGAVDTSGTPGVGDYRDLVSSYSITIAGLTFTQSNAVGRVLVEDRDAAGFDSFAFQNRSSPASNPDQSWDFTAIVVDDAPPFDLVTTGDAIITDLAELNLASQTGSSATRFDLSERGRSTLVRFDIALAPFVAPSSAPAPASLLLLAIGLVALPFSTCAPARGGRDARRPATS